MNEQLIVKNFGPIKEVTVDFKKVTVFIGPTGGGKSTLAKLAAVFRDLRTFAHDDEIFTNRSIFKAHNIECYFKPNTILSFERRSSFGIFINNELNRGIIEEEEPEFVLRDKAINEAIPRFNWLNEQIRTTTEKSEREKYRTEKFKLLSDKLQHDVAYLKIICPTIPSYFSNTLRLKYRSKKHLDSLLNFPHKAYHTSPSYEYLSIDFLKIKYNLHNGDIEGLDASYAIPLEESSSGIQSVTPMLVLLEHLSRQKEQTQSFIIEEPELNLYPTAQQGLMNWLVEKCTAGENDLTITTHSPYILSHLNLLLYAYQVAEKHPDRADDVAKLVPRESWINPKEFACYQVENGGVQSLVNEELGLINDNELDNLSGDSADAFDNLIRLSKSVTVK